MPFQTLNKVDPKIARGALASTVLSLSGPGIDDIPEQFRELSDAVLHEARSSLDIASDDYSWQATEKIRSFLAKEISRRVYEGFDKDKLTNRLGSEGKLSLGAYQIKASKVFKHAFKNENINFAIRCVKNADYVQHLGPSSDEEMEMYKGNTFSLFVSYQKTKAIIPLTHVRSSAIKMA